MAVDQVDEVIFGNVIGAGLGQNVARQAAIAAGLPVYVGATTINKMCGSGMKTVMLAAQAIQCGDAQAVVAGGVENMSAAPTFCPKPAAVIGWETARCSTRSSRTACGTYTTTSTWATFGDRTAAKEQISRQEQDDFAVASYQRSLDSQKEKRFDEELIAVEIKGRKGSVFVSQDEEPSRFNEEKLRALRPAFDAGGPLRPAMRRASTTAPRRSLCLAGEGQGSGRPAGGQILGSRATRGAGVVHAGSRLRDRPLDEEPGLSVADVDLFEINEAFSVVRWRQ